jgi:hypothetical protein
MLMYNALWWTFQLETMKAELIQFPTLPVQQAVREESVLVCSRFIYALKFFIFT